jgi:hypothetical protein
MLLATDVAIEYARPLIILFYPRHGDLPTRFASYRLPSGDTESPRIEVCTVDVSKPTKDVVAELKAIFATLSPKPLGQWNRGTASRVDIEHHSAS